MRKRTKAREYAIQLLYQLDVTRADSGPAIEEFWGYRPVAAEVQTFATRLVQGTLEHQAELDRLIASHASNWNINRMAVVDRNILRMGAYELLYLNDVPPKVCLNEAIELAKRFGDEESSKFVNGILDTIHKTQGRHHPGQGPAEGGDQPDASGPQPATPPPAYSPEAKTRPSGPNAGGGASPLRAS